MVVKTEQKHWHWPPIETSCYTISVPMLLFNLNLLLSDPLAFLLVLVTVGFALLVCITVHEFSHALAAYSLGDLTAQRLGRLSLNPIRHLDPMGTVLLLVVGFGWGKPVPVNPATLRRGCQGMAAVAAAGPISNIIAAFLFSIPFKTGVLSWYSTFFFSASFPTQVGSLLSYVVGPIVFFNIILAVFNLLPVFPLDGSNVAKGLLPRDLARSYARLDRYVPAILLMVIAFDFVTRMGILRSVIGPVVNYVGHVVVGQEFF